MCNKKKIFDIGVLYNNMKLVLLKYGIQVFNYIDLRAKLYVTE